MRNDDDEDFAAASDPGAQSIPGRDPDLDEPIEDLVARVRERVLSVESQQIARRERLRSHRWLDRLRGGTARRVERSGRWVNIGLLAVAIVVVALVVLLRISQGDNAPVVAAPAVTESSMADTTTAADALARTSADSSVPSAAAMVPTAWRSRCRSAPALRSNALAWVCAVNSDVSVEIVAFTNRADARAMLRAARTSISTRASQCAPINGQPIAWARHSDPDAEVGVFDCGTTKRGAELVWTVVAHDVVARAVRNDGDVQQLFDWWDSLNGAAFPL